jgi:two-component system CheB/CheR fusion protein
LTEDLLDASKMTAGRFAITHETVELADLVSQTARKYAATSQHEVDLSIEENVPTIEGDSVRLSQVIENLVSNAAKYSPEGSTITITLESSDEKVRLRVRDEGNGIASDKAPLIFERFFRVEEEGRMVKGTGLGLFISREIVRMHGGDITFESVMGYGTTFLVELPVHAQRRQEPAASRH